MKRYKRLGACLLLILVTTGCTPNNTGPVLDRAITNLKPALEQMDDRYNLYEDALEAVNTYLSDTSPQRLTEAKQRCIQSSIDIAKLPEVTSALTMEDKKDMVEIGLNITDYCVPFEMETYNKQQCVQSLTAILFYLKRQPDDYETLSMLVDLTIKNNDVFRKIDYLCINELFCRFEDDEIDSFRDDFLYGLQSLSADGLPWERDSAVLMAKADKLMCDAEQDINEYAVFVGERYKAAAVALNEWYPPMLSDYGYPDEEIMRVMLELTDEAIG